MKALFRNDYQWHEIELDYMSDRIYMKGTKEMVYMTDIVAIKDNSASDYVTCSHCGTKILNTPKAIQQHKELHMSNQSCFNCPYMRSVPQITLGEEYEPSEDNTYTKTKKETVNCMCVAHYPNHNINSDLARKYCYYKDCANAEMKSYSNFFSEHPNVFDDIITVDALDPNKWKAARKESYRDHIRKHTNNCVLIKTTSRLNLYAVVNDFGIIDVFQYRYKNNRFNFVYSKKYDKIFWISGSNYTENKPYYLITESAMDTLKKKVSELYKEA